MPLQLNISLEDLVFGGHADRVTEDLARGREVLLADLEVAEHGPQFGKREDLVRHQFEAFAVNFPCAFDIL